MPSGLTNNAGVLYNLGTAPTITLDPSASNGAMIGTVTINALDEQDLLDGKTYVNIHTAANPAGELRGQLVSTVIPEPHEWGFVFGLGALAMIGVRRRYLARQATVTLLDA